MLSRFCWGYDEKLRKIYRFSWDKLSDSKREGESGFRDLKVFNEVFIVKKCWRLVEND